MNYRKHLTSYVKQLATTLYESGVTRVVISPGSRSTPLAYAFAAMDDIDVHLQVDERSAAFFALGLAKAHHTPVALLCTSGTAASNYLPAITEAYYARVPLIAITADRPHELREVGAPQAIHQPNMFGHFVKASIDYPLADGEEKTERFVQYQTTRLLHTAMTAPLGPVHLNVPFREPLLIDLENYEQIAMERSSVRHVQPTPQLPQEEMEHLQRVVESAKRGLLVVGDIGEPFAQDDFWTFARTLGWPVLADPLSHLRANVTEENSPYVIDMYDVLLKSEDFREKVRPDVVIRFGAQPVSKPLLQFLEASRPETITFDEAAFYRDPIHITTYHVQASPEAVFHAGWSNAQLEYLNVWQQANQVAHDALTQYVPEAADEGQFVQSLLEMLPTGSDLISSSSMPIRDIDTFWKKTSKDIRVYANRGTNGIDGVTSTALGIQKARQRPATLLIGDLAFLHDTNGFLISRYESLDLTIVVFNNDGGGIFSYLPQSSIEVHYERLFGTPTGLTFEHLAKLYESEYTVVETVEAFQQAFQKEKTTPLRVIEVKTSRPESVKSHRTLWAAMEKWRK